MCTVEDAVVVSGERWTTPILLRHCAKIDGVTFAKLCKSDSIVRRLALAKCDGHQTMSLGKAFVFDDIIATRDAIIDDLTCDAKNEGTDEYEALDIDDAPTKKRKEPNVDIAEVATIMCPSHKDVNGMTVQVRLTKSKALWVAVTPEFIEYLMNMCQSQVMSDDVVPNHRKVYDSPPGTTWCNTRGLLRVWETDKETKQKRARYKKIAKVDPDAMRAAAKELRASFDFAADVM